MPVSVSDPTSSVTLEGDYNYQPDPNYVDPMGAYVPDSGSQYDPLTIQKMQAELEGNKAVARNRAGQPVTVDPIGTFTGAMKGLGLTLGSAGLGTAASVPGIFGDIESLGRAGLNYLSPNTVSSETAMPTTEDYLKSMSDKVPGLKPYTSNAMTQLGANVVGSMIDPLAAVKYAPAAGKLVGQGMIKTAEDLTKKYGLPNLQPGIMAGEKSNLWNSDFSNFAKQLEKEKYEPEVIHSLTGTYRGLDQKWRQEIPDIGAQMKVEPSLTNRTDLKVRDIIDHPKLFEAYPHLGDINVHMWDIPGATGRYNEMLNRIDLHNALLNDPKAAKKTLLHELQHAVQHYEGFEKGSNTSMHPPSHIMEDAYELEQLMNKNNISALDAAKLFEKEKGRPPHGDQYDNAVNIANHGQASLIPFIEPTDRYYHVAGEMEGDLPGVRMDLPEDQLSKHFPLKQGQHGLKLNPDNALVQKGVDKLGNPIYVTSKQLREQTQRNLDKPTAAQMKAEIKKRKEDDEGWNYAIKNPGGNWDDSRLDMLLRQHLHQSIPTVLRTRIEPGKNWVDVANEIGFSPEQIDRTAKDFALNNWIDKRLKNYIKNDLGTPKDPVRDLADQGITHMNDLGEGYERLHPSNQEVIYKMRERQGQQKEDYGKTNAGKDWENRSEYAVEPRSLREWAGENPQRMHNNPGFQKALGRDSEAKLNLFDSGAIRDLGFDHLTDELHAAIQSDSDLPQHLRLSTKDLERMTVPDAVRHVAKINKYRADLAEKATVKNLGEFRQNFPALKTYDNGMAWHELKEPDAEHSLPEGWKVVKTNQNTEIKNNADVYGLLNQHKFFEGDFHDSPEQVQAIYNRDKNREILDKALKEEGDLMGHCVGGYTDDVVNGSSRIFTLRDAKGKPHVTIETQPTTGLEESDLPFSDHHDVAQIKGKGNKEVSPKYHAEVIDFLNNVKPHVYLHDVNELRNVNAVDIENPGKQFSSPTLRDEYINKVNKVKQLNPNLPRFIDNDKMHELYTQIKKPIQGYKRGGHIKSLEHDRMKFELMMRGKHG